MDITKTTQATLELAECNAETTNDNANGSEETVVDFLVLDMAGNSRIYQAASIKDLRIQLAIQAGVFYPCIELFKRSTYALLANAHEITQIFNSETEPCKIRVVNNEEGVKKEVSAWDGSKWIDVLGTHIEQGDHGLLARARLVDSMVDEKIHILLSRTIRISILNSTRSEQLEVVRVIKTAIALGVNPRDGYVYSDAILISLAAKVDPDLLHILIEQGFNINAVGPIGSTALTRAIRWREIDTVQALLRAGADPNHRACHIFFGTPIYCAIAVRRVDLIALLIDAGADVNVMVGEGEPGETPLHFASSAGFPDVVRVLMHSGANVNAKDQFGMTPYEVAHDDACRAVLSGP